MYLSAVLDAHSRRVTGWSPDRTLDDELAIACLVADASQLDDEGFDLVAGTLNPGLRLW